MPNPARRIGTRPIFSFSSTPVIEMRGVSTWRGTSDQVRGGFVRQQRRNLADEFAEFLWARCSYRADGIICEQPGDEQKHKCLAWASDFVHYSRAAPLRGWYKQSDTGKMICDLTILRFIGYSKGKVKMHMTQHILVVDDNDMNLVLLSKILEMEGYQVTTALNGMEAIRTVRARKTRPGHPGRDDAGYERVRVMPEYAAAAILQGNPDRDADRHEQRPGKTAGHWRPGRTTSGTSRSIWICSVKKRSGS